MITLSRKWYAFLPVGVLSIVGIVFLWQPRSEEYSVRSGIDLALEMVKANAYSDGPGFVKAAEALLWSPEKALDLLSQVKSGSLTGEEIIAATGALDTVLTVIASNSNEVHTDYIEHRVDWIRKLIEVCLFVEPEVCKELLFRWSNQGFLNEAHTDVLVSATYQGRSRVAALSALHTLDVGRIIAERDWNYIRSLIGSGELSALEATHAAVLLSMRGNDTDWEVIHRLVSERRGEISRSQLVASILSVGALEGTVEQLLHIPFTEDRALLRWRHEAFSKARPEFMMLAMEKYASNPLSESALALLEMCGSDLEFLAWAADSPGLLACRSDAIVLLLGGGAEVKTVVSPLVSLCRDAQGTLGKDVVTTDRIIRCIELVNDKTEEKQIRADVMVAAQLVIEIPGLVEHFIPRLNKVLFR